MLELLYILFWSIQMNWIKELIEKLFFRNKIKMLEAPKIVDNIENNRNEFIMDLKRQADVEQDDGNGYKIIPNLRLEDMV